MNKSQRLWNCGAWKFRPLQLRFSQFLKVVHFHLAQIRFIFRSRLTARFTSRKYICLDVSMTSYWDPNIEELSILQVLIFWYFKSYSGWKRLLIKLISGVHLTTPSLESVRNRWGYLKYMVIEWELLKCWIFFFFKIQLVSLFKFDNFLQKGIQVKTIGSN